MNMSYCRFKNTLEDLRDCMQYLDDDSLSEAESKEREKLIKLCTKIASYYSEDDSE